MQNFFSYSPSALEKMPQRPQHSNKGTFGRVLVVGGSPCMSGAAYFSAKAAYRTGAGLVQILTHEDNRIILQTQLPEAILSTYSEENFDEDFIADAIEKADVIVIGVGLGQSSTAKHLLSLVLSGAEVPVVVDADALNILAKAPSLLDSVSAPLIITPHMMEMARLCHTDISEIIANPVDFAVDYATGNSLICVLKDHETIAYDGTSDSRIYVNKSGNSGMATGGSGDVLTGIIAALVAQGMPLFDATTLGVYIHGLAGDAAADELGEYSVMASDIIDHISTVIKDCRD
ncbi:MAG: NAD(P)H-hydrate dehydratase [Clostridia bacterium]|nr:NAD(P)H-hydrate dehydratase [Clostridia bacterium]